MFASAKSKIALAALILSCLSFVIGTGMLCYCPGPFIVAAVIALVGALTGTGRVQLAAALLCAVSLAMAVRQYDRKRHTEEIVERIRARSKQ